MLLVFISSNHIMKSHDANQTQSHRPVSEATGRIPTSIPRAAERETAAVLRRTVARRVRVVHKSIVVHDPGAPSVLIGVAIELERVLRVSAIHVAHPNLEVAKARRINSRTAWLDRVAEINGDVVWRAIADTKEVGGPMSASLKISSKLAEQVG